ncbi:hypothetical protein M407DRAFT_35167 [Tulasnella calospora MUT 4182]|uniref:Uncharacterized protein n=1 Tax=Tulasnella calospora MUT 4182 TaxID=1051891 RepID=A0A0C3PZH9_9AGAM|nr:hypothetical protein M407DRAFT_35167 [Tulasnella calospora MUT 4182]
MAQLTLAILDMSKTNDGFLRAVGLATDAILEGRPAVTSPNTADYEADLPRGWAGCLPAPRMVAGAPKLATSGNKECVHVPTEPQSESRGRRQRE